MKITTEITVDIEGQMGELGYEITRVLIGPPTKARVSILSWLSDSEVECLTELAEESAFEDGEVSHHPQTGELINTEEDPHADHSDED
jgi:hypothetical protein